MSPNLLKYSNGWGHVIISVASLAVAVILLLQHDPTLNGLAIGIITSVQGYWFITSAANTMKQQMTPAAPQPPATGGTSGSSQTQP